jgi:peptidoglycan/xylan/chitin deacetylase (PgdA/CDA1 family)
MTTLATRVLRRGSGILLKPISGAARCCLGVIRAVETDRPVLGITFDDGPHPEYTPAVLDILAKHRAHATFFMVGELAVKHPDVVRAAAQGGHAIANHSWGHVSFPLLTARECHEQLRRCEEALLPYGEKLFRPPYCHQTVSSRWHALRAGYDVVGFSVHAEDWLPRSAEWISERLVRQVRPGAIIILHDNIYRSVLPAAEHDRRPMLRALDRALEQLQEDFCFVTVPELLRAGRPLRENWYQRGLEQMQPALQQCLMEQRQQDRNRAISP